MRQACLTLTLLLAWVPLGAQDQKTETTTKTTVNVSGGDTQVLTGCVRAYGESGFVLTSASGKNGATANYRLVGHTDTLKNQVGHWVEIKGKAATSQDGEVKVKTETKVKPDDGDTITREQKATLKAADLAGLPYMGVQDVKMLAKTCR